ncbi:MAG: tRNA (adenosine(37)-N6)-dimethylallyltransferase MiaA [Bacteroides sp.]|nr:tRNA (adenosine(37)-N6)-dimethylallyltransferase MiaA [Ruminococcus flavefaciens]MCM1554768.1 tRNA (adenosine(37)-N6)-dimethylallyltransferase MiaA [Bacteroides sp.]
MSAKILKVLEGPTASGKTALAIEWALKENTEIVSADSRQFYRELNIGVARPSPEELAAVPHHFIANKSIFHYYSVSHYEQEALALLDRLFARHDTVIMAGGSGLYVNAVCHGIDELPDPAPELRQQLKEQEVREGLESLQELLKKLDPVFYEKVDLHNPVRLRRALEVCITTGKPYSSLRTATSKPRPFAIERYVLTRPKEELHDRIEKRTDLMMEAGLLNEAKTLYPHRELNALQTVGYRELFAYLDGKISLEQAVTDIKTNTRRYAKRQMTWLRRQDAVWL